MRKGFKKLICLGLTAAMFVGCIACGRNDDAKVNTDTANAALAKEHVYSEQVLDIPEMGENVSIRKMTQRDDTIYLVYEIYNWDEDTSENATYIMSLNMDGSNVKQSEMQMYMGGVKPEVPNVETVGEGETSESGESDKISVEEDTDYSDVYTYEYTGIGQIAFGNDGKLYGVKNYSYEQYDELDNYTSVNENFVCCWNTDGTMLWETQMEDMTSTEQYCYVQQIITLADGDIALLIGGDAVQLVKVSTDGTIGERTDLPEAAQELQYAYDVFMKEAGVVSYIYYDQEDYSTLWMNTYDFATNSTGEAQKLPESLFMNGYMGLTSGGALADIAYATSQGIFTINMGETEPTQVLSFVNSDIATTSMNNFIVLDETHIMGFYYDNIDEITKGSIFTKVNPEDVKDKGVLVLAANYIDWDLNNRVVRFNKTNPDYRIVIKDYSTYNTVDDYMAGYTQLNNDILSGSMPDILVADTNMPITSYIAKGLLADIDSLIAADEELSKVEFMQNVFEAYRVDGKLYHVIPSFYVRTLIGKTSIVGDRNTWTMQEMMDVMAQMPEGTQLIGEMTRDGFMSTMMQYCGNDFVDVSTGKCEFDSENFIAMLEYANKLPKELDEDTYNEEYWMNYESQYREDRTILMNCFISQARDMNININGYFGEDISYVGFPTDSGSGSVITPNTQYVLSAKSENLAGAWEFVRYYLTDEYQKELAFELPVNKALFIEDANSATRNPYYTDGETGELVEYEDTFYLNGESFTLPNMTQEQVDEYISFVESITKCNYYNQDVVNIIEEEAAAYFEGQKSAKEVADIIQSRVQIFVNENM